MPRTTGVTSVGLKLQCVAIAPFFFSVRPTLSVTSNAVNDDNDDHDDDDDDDDDVLIGYLQVR